MGGSEPLKTLAPEAEMARLASTFTGLPAELVVAVFATHEPTDLDKLMDRAFGAAYDDVMLQTLVTLSNGFAHTLERFRRRRGSHPIKLRCTTCQDRR
jgi:hypothetical protein